MVTQGGKEWIIKKIVTPHGGGEQKKRKNLFFKTIEAAATSFKHFPCFMTIITFTLEGIPHPRVARSFTG